MLRVCVFMSVCVSALILTLMQVDRRPKRFNYMKEPISHWMSFAKCAKEKRFLPPSHKPFPFLPFHGFSGGSQYDLCETQKQLLVVSLSNLSLWEKDTGGRGEGRSWVNAWMLGKSATSTLHYWCLNRCMALTHRCQVSSCGSVKVWRLYKVGQINCKMWGTCLFHEEDIASWHASLYIY